MILRPYLVIKNGSHSISYRVTKSPTSLDANEIAIRLELNLPEALFTKPTLEAKITVPKDAVSAPVIQAETVQNVEELIKQGTGFDVKLIQVADHDENA